MIERELHDYAEEAYLQYAVATVRDRALAQSEDGLKPVHRRILFAMQKLGLTATSKPVKSARVVGDVIGKYHPHGDTSAYEAMVRMAQDFSLRYPLVDGQGNFGSLDGDSAAAMRYTEARLSAISELLLSELNMGTVDFVPNYDNSQTEPARLPGRLPFLLLNGTTGIAVGMASNVPPHNLREVAAAALVAVAHPNAADAELLAPILGPDFPGGGLLTSSPAEIAAVYASGSGPLRVRARVHREDLARGQWRLVITELPYDVSPAMILEQLDAITAPAIRPGKKALEQEQLALRAAALDLIEKAVDESSSRAGMRVVLYPRTSKVSQDFLELFLYAHTSMESAFHANVTWLRPDGTPVSSGMAEILREWAAFRVQAVRRRTASALEKMDHRIHVLEGRSLILLRLEEVIQTIKNSDEPSPALQAAFGLSEIQATDILEMRLRQLSRLEGFALEAELAQCRKEAARLTELLASDKAMRSLVSKEIKADAERFGDDRRTELRPLEKAVRKQVALPVRDDPVTVMLTDTLWVKVKSGVDLADEPFKKGHPIKWQLPTTQSGQLILMDSTGRSYSIPVADLPSGRSEGEPLSKHVDFSGKLVFAVSGDPAAKVVLAGSQGYGFVTVLGNLLTRLRAGKQVLTLADNETPLATAASGAMLAVLSSAGRMLVFPMETVKELPKGKGVKLIGLPSGESVVEIQSFTDDLIIGGKSLMRSGLSKFQLTRGGKGFLLGKK